MVGAQLRSDDSVGLFMSSAEKGMFRWAIVLLGILFYLFIMWMPMLLLGPTTKNQNESNMGWPSSNLKSRLLGITGSC